MNDTVKIAQVKAELTGGYECIACLTKHKEIILRKDGSQICMKCYSTIFYNSSTKQLRTLNTQQKQKLNEVFNKFKQQQDKANINALTNNIYGLGLK